MQENVHKIYSVNGIPLIESEICALINLRTPNLSYSSVNKQDQIMATISSFVRLYFMMMKMGPVMRKCVLCHMRTTKVQIRLRIRVFKMAVLKF